MIWQTPMALDLSSMPSKNSLLIDCFLFVRLAQSSRASELLTIDKLVHSLYVKGNMKQITILPLLVAERSVRWRAYWFLVKCLSLQARRDIVDGLAYASILFVLLSVLDDNWFGFKSGYPLLSQIVYLIASIFLGFLLSPSLKFYFERTYHLEERWSRFRELTAANPRLSVDFLTWHILKFSNQSIKLHNQIVLWKNEQRNGGLNKRKINRRIRDVDYFGRPEIFAGVIYPNWNFTKRSVLLDIFGFHPELVKMCLRDMLDSDTARYERSREVFLSEVAGLKSIVDTDVVIAALNVLSAPGCTQSLSQLMKEIQVIRDRDDAISLSRLHRIVDRSRVLSFFELADIPQAPDFNYATRWPITRNAINHSLSIHDKRLTAKSAASSFFTQYLKTRKFDKHTQDKTNPLRIMTSGYSSAVLEALRDENVVVYVINIDESMLSEDRLMLRALRQNRITARPITGDEISAFGSVSTRIDIILLGIETVNSEGDIVHSGLTVQGRDLILNYLEKMAAAHGSTEEKGTLEKKLAPDIVAIGESWKIRNSDRHIGANHTLIDSVHISSIITDRGIVERKDEEGDPRQFAALYEHKAYWERISQLGDNRYSELPYLTLK